MEISQLTRPRYLIASMFILSLALCSVLYKPITTFNTTNPRPDILPYTPKKTTPGTESAVPVHVGVYVVNFPTFEILANKFIIDILLWFEFDPSLLPLETVDKFSFERGTIVSKSSPDMKIIEGKLFVQYQVRVQFSSTLDDTHFPLNDHRLYLVLENSYVTPQELYFTTSRSSFTVASDASAADWNIIDQSAQTGFVEAKLDAFDPNKIKQFPVVVFSIDLQKKGIRKILIIMLPMMLLLFISFFSLSLDPATYSGSILSLSTGVLTGLIAYRFVIEKIVPDVGYFTLADNFFNLFLGIIFCIFLLNIYAIDVGENTPQLMTLKDSFFMIINGILLAFFYFLVGT